MTDPRPYRCPVCRKPLSKRYRRWLTPLEWEKLQVAEWMKVWNREVEANRKNKKP